MLKWHILERALQQHPGLSWQSPQLKLLDHLYSSLDSAEGLYWAYERGGLVERLVTAEQIERFQHEPPENTRAWTRAMLLRRAGQDAINDVNWDRIRIRRPGRGWSNYDTLELNDPLAHTRSDTERFFKTSQTLEEILEALSRSGEPSRTERFPLATASTARLAAPTDNRDTTSPEGGQSDVVS